MITIMRRYFKGSANVVLWLIVAAFVVGLLPMAYKQMSDTALWAIKVNGQEIGLKEYMLEKEQQKNRILAFRTQYGEYADWLLSMMGMSDPQTLAVKSVARRELINQSADAMGVYIGDDYLMKKMRDPLFVMHELSEIIPPQIVDPVTGIDQQMLGRYLKHFGLSTDFLERQIERLLTEKLVGEMVQSSLYLPEFDIKQKYLSDFAKKSFSIVQVSLGDYEKELAKSPAALKDIEAFYDEQNKQYQRYMVPEKRSGKMWTFTPQSYGISVSDEQIAAYYEKHKVSKYTDKPAAVQVRRIVFAVADPAQRLTIQEKAVRIKDQLGQDQSQFELLAQRLSDDKDGLIKTFVRGQQEPSLDRGAFTLAKDGDISDVIETQQGFEILQRVAKISPVYKPFSAVAKEIKKELEKQTFEGQFLADIKRVIDNDESLTSFIAQKGGLAKDVNDLAYDESLLAKNFFGLKSGQKGFFVDGENGVAIRLDGVTEGYIPSFEAVKKIVSNDFYSAQAQKAMKDDLKRIKELLASTTIPEVQKTLPGATVTRTGFLNPSTPESYEALKNKGIPVDQMLQMEKMASVIIHIGDTHGFLIRLDEIEPFNQENYAQKRSEVIKELEARRGEQVMEGFVASLYRNATIETNESVITLQA